MIRYLAANVSSWEGAWPDIITMISAHNDQGSMKRRESDFQGKKSKKGVRLSVVLTCGR